MSRIVALLLACSLGLSAAAPAHCPVAIGGDRAAADGGDSGVSLHAGHGQARHTEAGHARGGAAGNGDAPADAPSECPVLAVCGAAAFPGRLHHTDSDVTVASERRRPELSAPSLSDLSTDPPPPRGALQA